tara:strand:- start:6941 stop:7198 length:258 start_codon:yes stop_codon:yes gene_type:complete
MASKRILKKNVNTMIFDVVEECYTLQMLDDNKTKDTDKLIDDAADYQDEVLAKINGAKNKTDFKGLREEIEAKAIDFINKLSALG